MANNTFIPHKRFVTVTKAEEWLVENARINPEMFIYYCLRLKPAAHHKEWLSLFFEHDNTLVNIIAPRESAKTLISVHAMAWLIGHYPARTNAIISVSGEQAKGRIADLLSLIRDNPAFHNVFPNIKIDTRRSVTQNKFSVVDVSMPYKSWVAFYIQSMKDYTVIGLGAGGKGVIGARISGVMLLDDIVDESEMNMPMQDKKERYIANTLMPCLQETARMWNIGTRWMTGDIYERYLKNPAWKSKVTPAIYEDDEGVQHSYWPGYWSLERLEKKRVEMDNDVLFGIMYLCTPADTTLGIFTLELFKSCVKDLSKLKKELDFKALFVTTDFAISLRTRADWNVIYACGVTYDDRIILLDGLRYKIEPTANVRVVSDFAYRINDTYGAGLGLTAILVEKIAFQSVFANFLAENNSMLPVQAIVPIGDKESRARPIRDYMLVDRFWIDDTLPFLATMRNEFVALGFARHDDCVDPIGLLLQHISRTHISATYKEIKNPFKL